MKAKDIIKYLVGNRYFGIDDKVAKIEKMVNSMPVYSFGGGSPDDSNNVGGIVDEKDPIASPKIGTLSSLATIAKNTLVAAINELVTKFSSYYTKVETDNKISTIELTPGPQGEPGLPGNDGRDGLTTSVNGVVQVEGNIIITTSDIPDYNDKRYITDKEKSNIHDPHSDDQDLTPYALISSLKIPFYKSDGTLDVIPLTSDQKIPFYTSAGVLDPIALTT